MDFHTIEYNVPIVTEFENNDDCSNYSSVNIYLGSLD